MNAERISNVRDLMYLWKVENFFLAGQPSLNSLIDLKERGVMHIINLRGEGEFDSSFEVEFCNKNNISYLHRPIMGPSGLLPSVCAELNKMVNTTETWLIHCASANRVAGWFITYLVLERGLDLDDAIDIASENGLTNPDFIRQAQEVIEALKK